jgi:polyferredoxin
MKAFERLLTRTLRSRLFPNGLRLLMLGVLLPILLGLLFGPAGRDSPIHLLVWLSWWPLLCVLFLAAGRIWCSMCPFSLVGDWVRRVSGLGLPVPEFLKQQEGWLIVITFFLLSWMEEVANAVDSPRATSIVLLLILSGAVAFSLFFRGHTWCRYLCPLGGLSLAYGRTALFKIRADPAACADCQTKDCVVPDARFPGCPMHLTPFADDSGANCKLCGLCVRRCTNGSLRVVFEAPSRDLAGAPAVTPPAVWMIVFLAGFISFLNAVPCARLPVGGWIHHSGHPVLLKTALMAAAVAAGSGLFIALVRLATPAAGAAARARAGGAAALPMIPLLLLTHLGYLVSRLWTDGDTLLASLATALGMRRMEGAEAFLTGRWTAYVGPALIALGLAAALGILRWALAQSPGLPGRRLGPAAALYYATFAAWNLHAVWPAATPAGTAGVLPGPADPRTGGAILWPFAGILAALWLLAFIARRQAGRTAGDADAKEDLSASRSWVVRAAHDTPPREMMDWMLEQAVHAGWRVPPVVALAGAGQEVVGYLQRALPEDSLVTVRANLQARKGVLTVSHEGRPLALPDYKAAPSLDAIDDASMDGLELRLAAGQVEHMSYQARLSDSRCSFTLRQSW